MRQGYRYTVYERATDDALIYDGRAVECARLMDVTLETFYTYVSKQKKDPGFGKFEIVVDEDSLLGGRIAKVICERCEKVFVGGQYTFVCPDCRRKALRESAASRDLANIGKEAYLKQLSIRGTKKRRK